MYGMVLFISGVGPSLGIGIEFKDVIMLYYFMEVKRDHMFSFQF